MDQQVIQAQINELVRARARLKLTLVEAQMHQQANGGDAQVQTKTVSLEAQLKGIDASLLDDYGVTPEEADRRASRLLGIADSSVTPSNSPQTPATSGHPTGSPSTPATNGGTLMTHENRRTNGVPVWLAIMLGLLLIFVLFVIGFTAIDNMNKTGSTQPAVTMAPENPTATPTIAPTSTPTETSAPTTSPSSDDQTTGAPVGTESEGCLNGLPVTPDHTPSGEWTIPCDGMYRAINYWNQDVPEYNRGQSQTNALFVCYDQHVVLHGRPGGSQYQWIYGGEAKANFDRSVSDNNPEVKLSDLVAQGLATVTVEGGGKSLCDNPNWLTSGIGGSPTATQPPTATNGDAQSPAPQDGCTDTNKQTTPDEIVAVGSHEPLNFLHRIDSFGYSGWSLSEFYTLVADKSEYGAHRVPTIGYVSAPRETLSGLVGIWFGQGSFWDFGANGAQCNREYALDKATDYAISGAIEPGRLENGHSGVVVDMSSCTLYNNKPDLGWNHDNIQALLNDHLANMVSFPCNILTDDKDGSTYEVTPTADDLRGSDQNLPSGPAGSDQCSQPRTDNFGSNFQGRKLWHITTSDNEVAVVNFWSNWTDPNYPFVKFKLGPNSDKHLKGGGDVTFFPADCQDQVAQAMKKLSGNQKVIDFSDLPSKYKK